MKPTGRQETVTERKKSEYAARNCVKLNEIFKKSILKYPVATTTPICSLLYSTPCLEIALVVERQGHKYALI